MEQRKSPRYEVNVSCRLDGPITGSFSGVIKNISRGGVCVLLDAKSRSRVLPVVGEVLSVDIALPINKMFGQKCLRCAGTVVRVCNSRRGVPELAISVDQMQFSSVFRSLEVVNGKGREEGGTVKSDT